MLQNIRKKIRLYWHDLYYFLASKQGIHFAMTCKDATAKIDLNDQAVTITDKTRLKLHISLCQACYNYYSLSQTLRRLIRKLVISNKNSKADLEKLNRDLLKKYNAR